MKLDETLQRCIQALVEQGLIKNELKKVYSIAGGSVNLAYGIETKNESLFIKLNQKDRFPKMFSKEVSGLQCLKACKAVRIPQVLYEGSIENTAFLVLELIREGNKKENYWEELGEGVAAIHLHSNNTFGLDYDNYNGSLVQVNDSSETWSDFFIRNRLLVQLKMAADTQKVGTEFVHLFEGAIKQFQTIFPIEKPSLLHGDLWSGNFITDEKGSPVLIDPAVYYGHREVDLAMSMLFGGFHRRFYEAYHAVFPLERDWETRVDILNLYPLMVHVNLFGTAYVQRVKSILNRLV